MLCHLILLVVEIMNAIQPIRGQESLYKLYNTDWPCNVMITGETLNTS